MEVTMRCFIKDGKVELVDTAEGFTVAVDPVRRSVFELHSRAQHSGKVRGAESATLLATEIGDSMKRSEQKAVDVHGSLDPMKVFELLQVN
jgi:hypothetical protein